MWVDQSDVLDLLDIPMDDIHDTSELDDCLSKPVEMFVTLLGGGGTIMPHIPSC